MRKVVFVVIGAVVAVICLVCLGAPGISLDPFEFDKESYDPVVTEADNVSDTDDTDVDNGSSGSDSSDMESREAPIDTIMYANGHFFGWDGLYSDWGVWYYDTVSLGNEPMLKYERIEPSTLKLSLVTRDITVDLGSPGAEEKLKSFLKPIDGFRRHEKVYHRPLGLLDLDEDTITITGELTFGVEYLDSCKANASVINRFVGDLACEGVPQANVPSFSAMYAGYNPAKYFIKKYKGNPNDIEALSEFIVEKAISDWKRGGLKAPYYTTGLGVRADFVNPQFFTCRKLTFDREGFGHGMYTETFHTIDLSTGKRVTNSDLFKPNTLEKVKTKLYETIAEGGEYTVPDTVADRVAAVRERIVLWIAFSDFDDNENVEKAESRFTLPDGALTKTGVIFSFQPYEIDCFAAGCYHFIVPYKKLKPYMTSRAKKLIKSMSK